MANEVPDEGGGATSRQPEGDDNTDQQRGARCDSGWSVFDRWIKRLKPVTEKLALGVGAAWVYTQYLRTDAPSLEQRTQISGAVTWYSVGAEECSAEYEVSFKNIGKTPIDITSGVVSVWATDDTPKLDRPVALFDPTSVESGQRAAERVALKDVLIGHYAPDVGDKVGFNFRFQRRLGRTVVFRVQLNTAAGQPELNLYDHRWDYVCGVSRGDAAPPSSGVAPLPATPAK